MSFPSPALIEAVQSAARRQWAVFALAPGDKVPLKGTRGVNDATTDVSKIQQLAKLYPGCNWGVATGSKSGIVVIDIDPRRGSTTALESLAQQYGELPQTATVSTPSGGEHLYYASGSERIPSNRDKLGSGIEVKGDGAYVVLPGGKVDGVTYTWTKDRPFEQITVLPDWIGSVAEIAECHSLKTLQHSSPIQNPHSDYSAVSATSSVSEVIRATLPRREGERNAKIFDLARGLKFNVGCTDLAEMKQHVREWHRLALPVITTKAFDLTWADFRHAINTARMPLGIDSVDLAAARVDINDLPPVADEYDSTMTRTVIGLCYELAKENNGNFFLSSHDLAPRLRTTPMQAYRLLKMLVADGVLRIVEPGNQYRANRYFWQRELPTLGQRLAENEKVKP